jgi:hypothetical protein
MQVHSLTYLHLFVGFLASLINFPFLTLLVLHIVLEVLVRTDKGKKIARQYLPNNIYSYILDYQNTLASTIALFVGYLVGGFFKK